MTYYIWDRIDRRWASISREEWEDFAHKMAFDPVAYACMRLLRKGAL